jgi:hypothetical protein
LTVTSHLTCSLAAIMLQDMDDDYYESIDLHIRWSNEQDLGFTVSPSDSVASVKEKVCSECPTHTVYIT